jgi:hypothetical protein
MKKWSIQRQGADLWSLIGMSGFFPACHDPRAFLLTQRARESMIYREDERFTWCRD